MSNIKKWNEETLDTITIINPESLAPDTPPTFQFQYIDISSVNQGTVNWHNITTHTFLRSPSRAKRVIRYGDILLCAVRPTLQAHTIVNWQDSNNYVCSTGFAVLRGLSRIEPRYLYHSLFSESTTRQLRAFETGSNYPAINEADVRKIRVSVPSLPEQIHIANVLDAVDKQISYTEQIIAKLKLQKAGLLHDLLTCGIDEKGYLRDPIAHPEQFKDSVLGRIPREWNISELSTVCYKITDGCHQSVKTSDNGIPFLFVSCIRDGKILWNQSARIAEETYREISRGREPKRGAVLYTVVGSYGHAAMVKDETPFSFQRHIAYILPDPNKVHPAFLTNWLNSSWGHSYADKLALGNAQKTITLTYLFSFPVLLPELEEQKSIACSLASLEREISTEEMYLEKLKLYKKGLMHDLLTGRVRVVMEEELEGG